MANKLPSSPYLPQPQGQTIPGLYAFARSLIQTLSAVLVSIVQRLNVTVTNDGEEPMIRPLLLAEYTIATLPVASVWRGGVVYLTNGASNKRMAISDGTIWRYPDGAAV